MAYIPFGSAAAVTLSGPLKLWAIEVDATIETENVMVAASLRRDDASTSLVVRFAFASMVGIEWSLHPGTTGPLIVREGQQLLLTFEPAKRFVSGRFDVAKL